MPLPTRNGLTVNTLVGTRWLVSDVLYEVVNCFEDAVQLVTTNSENFHYRFLQVESLLGRPFESIIFVGRDFRGIAVGQVVSFYARYPSTHWSLRITAINGSRIMLSGPRRGGPGLGNVDEPVAFWLNWINFIRARPPLDRRLTFYTDHTPDEDALILRDMAPWEPSQTTWNDMRPVGTSLPNAPDDAAISIAMGRAVNLINPTSHWVANPTWVGVGAFNRGIAADLKVTDITVPVNEGPHPTIWERIADEEKEEES